MSTPSLDFVASVTSQRIANVIGKKVKNDKLVSPSDLENLVTKALGVLQSQGVYAMALFLFSRSGDKTVKNEMTAEERCAVEIISRLYSLRNPSETLKNFNPSDFESEIKPNEVNSKKKELLKEFADISNDLDTLLLVRDLYEKILVYARFHAKAAKEGS